MPKLALSLSGDTSSAAGLTAGNMQFARQLGATHVVFSDEAGKMVPNEEGFWHEGDLRAVRERVEAGGLELAAIENFPAQHWDKILLGAEGREEQLANLSRTIVRLALLSVLPTSSSPWISPRGGLAVADQHGPGGHPVHGIQLQRSGAVRPEPHRRAGRRPLRGLGRGRR